MSAPTRPTAARPNTAVAPVVGLVGGGQLSRMTHQAAIRLGVDTRLLATSESDSASRVIPAVTIGDHRDLDALMSFGAGCDVVTFDHEHVPADHLRALQRAGVTVHPGPDALVHAQDKLLMRDRLAGLGLASPSYACVTDVREVESFAANVGWPVVLKTPRGGYDGRGVWVAADPAAAAEVLDLVASADDGPRPLLAEAHVSFRRELAAVVARSPLGQAVAYPVVETVQRDGMCREVLAPAPDLDPDRAIAAQQVALTIAHELGVTGVLAVEMFEVEDGVLVNELAMRPHNSGHWTIDAATTSQFEQHLRAVLDLPLGAPLMTAPVAVMVNVVGGAQPDPYGALLHVLARDPSAHVHLYGKAARPGRKLGHVTVVGDDLDDLRARARHAAACLGGDLDERDHDAQDPADHAHRLDSGQPTDGPPTEGEPT